MAAPMLSGAASLPRVLRTDTSTAAGWSQDRSEGARATEAPAPKPARIESIDTLRGIVIVLMALDHVREFFHAGAFAFDPMNLEATSAALYLTRWITHFSAPTFVLLAGVSAYLVGVKSGSRATLSRFLVTRGLWLILLEATVVSFAWHFSIFHPGLGVIWAIGASMVALAALVWTPRWMIIAVALAILVGHNALDRVAPSALGALAPLRTLLLEGGLLDIGVGKIFVTYAAVPWLGFMALGYAMGPLFDTRAPMSRRGLVPAGLILLAGFVLLRAINHYGDPAPWSAGLTAMQSVESFFNATKYPPSLVFTLMTLGPILVVLYGLERMKFSFLSLFTVYGRSPLLFYVAHLFLIHGLMMLTGMAMGIPPGAFVTFIADRTVLREAGWGFSLAVVYGVWALVVVALYPACRWLGQIKARRRDWWLSYL